LSGDQEAGNNEKDVDADKSTVKQNIRVAKQHRKNRDGAESLDVATKFHE
jgi:hypothetical protein